MQITEVRVHVLVSPLGRPGGLIDRVLAEDGQTRRVAVTTPHFLIAQAIVAASDHVCTLPSKVAEGFARVTPLRLLRPPLRLPSFTLSMPAR